MRDYSGWFFGFVVLAEVARSIRDFFIEDFP
jgi:hypothetical protein